MPKPSPNWISEAIKTIQECPSETGMMFSQLLANFYHQNYSETNKIELEDHNIIKYLKQLGEVEDEADNL